MKTYFENKMNELREKIEKSESADEVRALGAEIDECKAQIAKIEEDEQRAAQTAAQNAQNAQGGFNPVASYGKRTDNPKAKENPAEVRANKLVESGKMSFDTAEARAVLVSSGDIATPTEVGGINDTLGAKVSSIVDMVKVVNANGMGAYKVALMTEEATAATQTEGAAYNNSEPVFDSVEIKPQTEAILSYISKQARKQTPLNYSQKVSNSALVALRRRAAKIITDKLVASPLNTALPLTAIDAGTLRKISLNYGGDESVVGSAVLFLTKADIVKFGDVRGSNEKKAVYEITPDAANPNTGIIRDGGLSVPYCINSNLTEGTLAYGQPMCFELALFSPYEIAVSEDFAFDKGMLAIRGDVELGGAVTVKNGFVLATVGA